MIPPTANQPPSTGVASNNQVTPCSSVASPGTPSRISNSPAASESQTAAPLTRFPTIMKPDGPATIRATFTACGPP